MAYVLDDWEEIQARSARQLPTGNNDVPWGTGLVEGAKDLAGRAVNQLQEWAKDDPDTWTDDAIRLMGGGVKNVGNTMADLERRSEEGEVGIRSLAGTALRFSNWASEKGADFGGATAKILGVNEELGRFGGSFIPELFATKGITKVSRTLKYAKHLNRLQPIERGKLLGGTVGAAQPSAKLGRVGATRQALTLSKSQMTSLDEFAAADKLRTNLIKQSEKYSTAMDRYDEATAALNAYTGPKGKGKAGQPWRRLQEKQDTSLRTARDLYSTPVEDAVNDLIGSKAKKGYKAQKGKPGGAVDISQKNLNLIEQIHQHHGWSNVESYSFTKLVDELGLKTKIQAQRYIAQKYKVTPGASRANMWNIPGSIHLKELHPWLEKMGFEDYWQNIRKRFPNGIDEADLVDTLDTFFDEVYYPSIIKTADLIETAPKQHKWHGLHLPQDVLSDARKRVTELTKIKPFGATEELYQRSIDDIQRLAEQAF